MDEPTLDPLRWLQAAAPHAAATHPARWAGLQALARRAAAADGRLRERLIERLQQTVAELPAPAPSTAPPRPSRLRALLDRLGDAPPALRSQQLHQRSWTRLRVARRLAELQPAQAPSQALGPLNAMALLPRALAELGEASPEYLQRFLAFADALAALPAAAPRGRALKPGGAAR